MVVLGLQPVTLVELHFAKKEMAFVLEECFENLPYTRVQVLFSLTALKTTPCSCRRLLSDVFQRKADYFILTTTSVKTIQLTTALLHHFCDFLVNV